MASARQSRNLGGLASQACWGESHHWPVSDDPGEEDAPRVVVDLGGDKSAGYAAAQFDPSVVILTHSDHDHIKGSKGFFDELAPGSDRELWVPHDWIKLVTAEAGLGEWENSSLDAIGDFTEAALCLPGILDGSDASDLLIETWQKLLAEGTVVSRAVREKSAYLRNLLDRAAQHGMKIRYFSVDHPKPTWETEGLPGVATLVNAVEESPGLVPPDWSSPGVVFALYALTRQNKRALVTYLWRSDDQAANGALIWSDTDGSTCGGGNPRWIPWGNLAVMSAPHHGSAGDAHKQIWGWREEYRSDLPVVLAGGMYGQAAAPEFLGLDQGLRGCTMCGKNRRKDPDDGYWKVASVPSAGWLPSPSCRLECR